MAKQRLLPDLAAGLRTTLSRGKTTPSPGTKALSGEIPKSTSKSTPPSTPKSTSKPSSSTAQVPKGGQVLPTTGNSSKARLAKSLIKKGIGRFVPYLGLVLTAAEVVNYLGGGETAASKQANYGGQMGRGRREQEEERKSSQERAERITKDEPFDITELRMKEDLKNPRYVRPAPRPRSEGEGKELAARAAERRAGSGSSRPSTVDTQSKKPIAKRIMEALGDNRTMEQATEDARITKEMEMEREMNVAGRKKGGMATKKKAPVKKAYGGMVKKKQGGSANKVNMKAGFTRRGCSKG
jgi:hypothetical protein